MTFLAIVGSLAGLVLLVALVTGGYTLVLMLWTKTHQKRAEVAGLQLHIEQQRLSLAKERQQVTQQIWPDDQGVYPLLWDGHLALDVNRGVVFSISEGARVVTPALARPEQLARLVRSGGGWPRSDAGTAMLTEPVSVNWPSRVPLRGLLDGPPSFRALVLGVTLRPDGGQEIVRGDVSQMVHVAVGGSSGWGKSVFLRSLVYQLARSAEPVDLALVDLEAVTFAPFATCARLLWPIADTESDALAIFSELTAELDRRKELFAAHPGVDSLAAYNTQADKPLTPVTCLVDEATALLGDKDVESALRTLTLRARKYGLWLVLGGQDWKATSLNTAIRNQLSSRFQFKAMSASQSRVLLQQAGAENLDAKGQALAWLPGRDLLEIQAPWVSRGEILAAMGEQGPQLTMPETPGSDQNDERTRRVLDLHAQGKSDTAIAFEVFGHGNTHYIRKVRQILQQQHTEQESDMEGS